MIASCDGHGDGYLQMTILAHSGLRVSPSFPPAHSLVFVAMHTDDTIVVICFDTNCRSVCEDFQRQVHTFPLLLPNSIPLLASSETCVQTGRYLYIAG